MIDDENLNRRGDWLQLQAKLLFHGFEQGRSHGVWLAVRAGVRGAAMFKLPAEREIEPTAEARLIDQRSAKASQRGEIIRNLLNRGISGPQHYCVTGAVDCLSVAALGQKSARRHRWCAAIRRSDPLGVARQSLGMWPESRTRLPRSKKNQSQCRSLPHFKMRGQFEAIGEQRLHHEPHLVFGWIARRLGLNDELVLRYPFW